MKLFSFLMCFSLLVSGLFGQGKDISHWDSFTGVWKAQLGENNATESWVKVSEVAYQGVFTMVNKSGEVVLSELMTLSMDNDSIILKMKHFESDLSAWEKDAPLRFYGIITPDKKVSFKAIRKQDPMGIEYHFPTSGILKVDVLESKHGDFSLTFAKSNN